jgi:hypothetical protein
MTSTANTPNHFTLTGEGAQISYTTTGIDGHLRFNYEIGEYSGTARGDEIRAETTEIGQLITITLAAVPDQHTITLTVLLPAIHLGGPAVAVTEGAGDGTFQTQAIVTTHHTSFGGPRLVQGAVETYQFVTLAGRANVIRA